MSPGATIQVESQFGPMEAFADDLITDQIIAYGNHTRPEFAFSTSILDVTANAFDLGAHIGTWSLAAKSRLAPGARILAVEGNTATFDVLRNNMARLGGPDCLARNAFVGPPEPVVYVETPGNSGANALRPGSSEAQLDWISIDELVTEHFAPGYIKVDLEGYEVKALLQSSYIRAARPFLYVEVSEPQLARLGDTPEDLHHWLRDLGYAVFRNRGDRNARHDVFRVAEVHQLPWFARHRGLFDALCVPEDSTAAAVLRAAVP